MCGEWRLLKHIVEAEFGPDAGVNTVLVITPLESKPEALQDSCKWMTKEGARELLSDVKTGDTRIGPYVHAGFVKLELSSNCTTDSTLVSQRCNPDAVLLTHENTMKRIGKGNWSTGYTAVTGGESICIGDQELQVIFAPGHTDGHMGLLHVNTNALIVGDHCVGHGSAILDNRAGGNMKDYFQTTYKFLEISPHVLIPMHGRINLWPKHMLCGYLKNRKAREASILQSIENGAQTLFDIVSKTYCDVDRKLWIPASFNVRLHVDHLNSQQKLPKDFSTEKFESSCGAHFIFRWGVAYAQARSSPALIIAASALAAGGLAIVYALRRSNVNQP
ncbi:hypothetical protein TRIUR3_03392 [Triticum urartu]|uniref:LACTB2 winged helix domain-containing protein n=1 Tax=Triticum urartu TaxID=4572 RepID=M7ZLT1_TRIUA|nr:hypothetical protein TRIUR3_03392 [Triticum urartu]